MGKLINKLGKSRRALLQVALDFTSIKDALRILNLILNTETDIIEFGTPLIKTEGMRRIFNDIINKLSINAIKLADTKTADVGSIEVSEAWRYGFDVTTVLASTNDEVIREALMTARKYGMDVVVDTVGIDFSKLGSRIDELVRLGVELVNIHVGIDVQRKLGVTASSFIKIIRDLIGSYGREIRFSVSGGIKPHEVCRFVDAGASVVVIGSAITRSKDPLMACREALSNLKSCTP